MAEKSFEIGAAERTLLITIWNSGTDGYRVDLPIPVDEFVKITKRLDKLQKGGYLSELSLENIIVNNKGLRISPTHLTEKGKDVLRRAGWL